jgi:DNA repair and recombination protein RAD54B
MPFKPFKPPLIRKDLSNDIPRKATDNSSAPPPSKRPRLSVGENETESNHKAKPVVVDLTLPDAGIVRKSSVGRLPLVNVKNTPGEIETSSIDNGSNSSDVEAYYNVLWYVHNSTLELTPHLTKSGANSQQRSTKPGMATES